MNSSPTPDLPGAFIEFSREALLDQFWPRLRSCVESLTDEQIWWRPNESCNSIGNLILHLNGNVTQWIIASFSHSEDRRDRAAEFSRTDGISRADLLSTLAATMKRVAEVLSRLSEEDLRSTLEIQGYRVTGMEAIYHVVEHFSLHYGQITYLTKMLRDEDLGFYKELNQTGRAAPEAQSRP